MERVIITTDTFTDTRNLTNLRCFLFEATKEINMIAENQRQMHLVSIPDLCQFWGTTASLGTVKVHQKVFKFATKLAKNFAFSVQQDQMG